MKDAHHSSRFGRRLAAAMLLACGASITAFAAPASLSYDSFLESKTVGSPLQAGSTMLVDGKLVDSTSSSITNTLFFTMGSTSLSVSAGWLVAPAQNRTLAVNIDLYDSSHTLVASDVFQSLNGSLATSQLTATNLLAGGVYELVLTGNAAQYGRYTLAMTAGGAAAPPIDSLPVAAPPLNQALFDTHAGTKTFGNTLVNGGEIIIDGKMEDDLLSAITNEFKFSNIASVVSAGIEWIVGQPGDPQRTVGFNVDVFDASNTLVASDTFQGLQDGQGFSQFVAAIAPGLYTLRVTGTATLGSRYRIHLTTNEVPPGFEPLDGPPTAAVPEPGSWALLAVGLGAAFVRRSLQSHRR